jgi:transposase
MSILDLLCSVDERWQHCAPRQHPAPIGGGDVHCDSRRSRRHRHSQGPSATPVPGCKHIWADQGYTGTLVHRAEQEHGWRVQVVYPQDRQLKRYAPDVLDDLGYKSGFKVIPKRWIVARTFSWIGRQRRLSKDYERLTSSEEAFMYLVGICLLLTRLAPG